MSSTDSLTSYHLEARGVLPGVGTTTCLVTSVAMVADLVGEQTGASRVRNLPTLPWRALSLCSGTPLIHGA